MFLQSITFSKRGGVFMPNIQLAIMSGVFFGLWPLFMNKSGLGGTVSSFVFMALCLILLTPFAFSGLGGVKDGNWTMIIVAAILGSLGMICFNTMLSRAKPSEASTLFVVMVCVQVSMPFLYHLYIEKSITLVKGIGFVFAFLAAILLSL